MIYEEEKTTRVRRKKVNLRKLIKDPLNPVIPEKKKKRCILLYLNGYSMRELAKLFNVSCKKVSTFLKNVGKQMGKTPYFSISGL